MKRMETMAIVSWNWNEPPPDPCQAGAVTIGNFDGVHQGHLSLLAELQKQAQEVKGPAVVLTFDPHPLQLLRPEQFQPVLTTPADRAELLQANGANHVLIALTTPELLHLTAPRFFEEVVHVRLAARALVEGVTFGFGHNREGTVETLASLCRKAEIVLSVVPPLKTADGVIVSSSRVRSVLLAGDVRGAADLLARPFRLRGTVGGGQSRGRTLGFPTANLEGMEMLVPGNGVYAGRALHRGSSWPAAINIGPNPTFGEQERKVEVHVIGFNGDLVGQELALDFLDRLRDTRPFASVGELIKQLRTDVHQAQHIAGPAK